MSNYVKILVPSLIRVAGVVGLVKKMKVKLHFYPSLKKNKRNEPKQPILKVEPETYWTKTTYLTSVPLVFNMYIR